MHSMSRSAAALATHGMAPLWSALASGALAGAGSSSPAAFLAAALPLCRRLHSSALAAASAAAPGGAPAAAQAAPEEVPVVIAGGGPTGLTTALLLAKYGVRSVVLEKRQTLTDHPQVNGGMGGCTPHAVAASMAFGAKPWRGGALPALCHFATGRLCSWAQIYKLSAASFRAAILVCAAGPCCRRTSLICGAWRFFAAWAVSSTPVYNC